MVWGLAAAGFLALAICLIALPLGRVLGVMDIPDGVRHRHKLMPWRWGLVGYLTLVAAPGIAARMAPDWTILWAASGLAIYGAVVAANHWDAQARRMRLRLRQEG